MATGKKKDYEGILDFLGFQAHDSDDTHWIGTCPFPECGKEKHFFVNKATGQWDCKRCGMRGNCWTLLTDITANWQRETTDEKYTELAHSRGLPIDAFKRYGFCWNGREWCLPAYGEQGKYVHNVYRWAKIPNAPKTHSTKVLALEGLEHVLLGCSDLSAAPRGATIVVVEGQWDLPAWRWALDGANRPHDVVVGVPGANVFKPDWVRLFSGKNVKLIYHNDLAGDRGMWRAGEEMLRKDALSLAYVHWPELYKEGYDLRDLVKGFRAKRLPPKNMVAMVDSLLQPNHRRHNEYAKPTGAKSGVMILSSNTANGRFSGGNLAPDPAANGSGRIGRPSSANSAAGTDGAGGVSGFEAGGVKVTLEPGEKPATFKELVKEYGKWLEMTDDLVDALTVAAAVAVSHNMPGCMLWLYVVGAPSTGKSAILGPMADSERIVYLSSIRAKSLVSGWAQGPDPSILPTFSGKTAIINDGTVLFNGHPEERKEVFNILRDAYSGRFKLPYGHGPVRTYVGLKFNMIIGITVSIHGEDQAEIGERFLRIQVDETQTEGLKKARKAIDNCNARDDESHKAAMDSALTNVMTRFLWNEPDPQNQVQLSDDYANRIANLSQFVAFMRAQVSREKYNDREMRFKPAAESPPRLSEQLAKLCKMIAFIRQETEVSNDTYRLVRKVAFDSCNQFHLDVLKALLVSPEPLTVAQVSDKIGQSVQFVHRRIDDLEQLQIIVKDIDPESLRRSRIPGARGPKAWTYKPCQYMRELWSASKVWISPQKTKQPSVETVEIFEDE